MVWLAYSLSAVLFWGAWAFLGKVALRHLNWIQVALLYGIGIAAVLGVLLVALRSRPSVWTWSGVSIGTASALLGTAGVVTFYLALERGKASVVVPLVCVYPIVTSILAVLFLGERLSGTQIAGIGLAVLAVVLISLGR